MNNNRTHSIFEVLDQSSIYSILIITVLISSLSLVIPIAAQTLINLVAFGKLLQPVLVLSLMVFVLMVSMGLLSIWQKIIIEIIQQKFMVRISLSLAKHFTHLSPAIFSTHNGPELVNRYFEITTINKALASLLLYGTTLSLQMLFGLILLLFYHPVFLLFDIFILASLVLIIWLPYRLASESAKQECSEKHIIGGWLEEILINRYLFKFNEYPRYVIEQTDKKLMDFLRARNKHFKQLVKHEIGLYALSAFATSLLLGLGGYLIINNQLSLGQLVASEIVLGTLIYGFKRLGALLENYYDLRASLGKIDLALNLPLENTHQEATEKLLQSIDTIQLSLESKTANQEGRYLQAEADPNNPLLLKFKDENSCKQLIDSLSGLDESLHIKITLNQLPCAHKTLIALRKYSLLIREPQWFAGTIYQNLVLNHRNISANVIYDFLKKLNLLEKIMACPNGLDTLIQDWQTQFTLAELIKLMIVRAIIDNPKLIIIDRSLDELQETELDEVLSLLKSLADTTLIITTLKPDFNKLPNHLVFTL